MEDPASVFLFLSRFSFVRPSSLSQLFFTDFSFSSSQQRMHVSTVSIQIYGFNPFTATACQIAGLNDALTRLDTVYISSGRITYLLSMLCVFMKILAQVNAKKHKKA